jgi:hypothetical protein
MGVVESIFNFLAGSGDQAVKFRTALTGVDPVKAAEIQQATIAAASAAVQQEADNAKAQIALDQASLGVTGTNFFKFWVAGARPLVLWVCGVAFLLQYVILPIGAWCGAHWPPLDMGVPTQVVLGALGLGQIVTRGIEKINGAASNH